MTQKGKRQTHCKRGHEFTQDNIYVSKGEKHHCRQCRKERHLANPIVYDAATYDAKRAKGYREKFHHKNFDANRKYWLRKSYGLTLEEFQSMWDQQNGKCAICGKDLVFGKETHVDHDHDSDVVRDLLCNFCNLGLGQFKDNPDILEKAASYLRRHNARP
jgi:hypothetical protein